MFREKILNIELAKKAELLRMRQLSGENLRNELYTAVKLRCEDLANLTL